MDTRTDTSSLGRFGGQWAFLAAPSHHGHARSLPQSSSYLRSDRSNVSPLLQIQQFDASRSSLSRNAQARSVGSNTSTTIPSQPVLLRVHSADASIQIHPRSRPPKPRKIMSRDRELPPLQEYGIQGILAAIQEDIEEDVNAISEILGRSRLVLADQHESHLPPQGEIRAVNNPLQAVAEASASNERLAAIDDVLILREDASLVDGSHTGSAAYGLLERAQVNPRTRHGRVDGAGQPATEPGTSSPRNLPPRMVSAEVSPGVQDNVHAGLSMPSHPRAAHPSRQLLPNQIRESGENQNRTTNAVVSETYLSAGANAVTAYDYNELFEGSSFAVHLPRPSFRERLRSIIPTEDLAGLLSWVQGHNDRVVTAESQLRDILDRQERRRRHHHDARSGPENLM
nr:hypothetical protein LTR18_000046 [Exophiala xenobiotica]